MFDLGLWLLSVVGCPTGGKGVVELVIEPPKAVNATVDFGGGFRLAPGENSVSSGFYRLQKANRILVAHPIASLVYVPQVLSGSEFCLMPNTKATVRLRYNLLPTSGRLWLGTTNGLYAVGVSDLEKPGVVQPVVAHRSVVGRVRGLSFDEEGYLWVADSRGIYQFSPWNFRRPLRQVKVEKPVGYFRRSPTGQLWVTHPESGEVMVYDGQGRGREVSRLATPGPIAFDRTGHPWVAEIASGTLVRLSEPPIKIQVRGQKPLPEILPNVRHIAFDREGHLWAAFGFSILVQLKAEQLGSSGLKEPDVILPLGAHSLLSAMAWDRSGHLWVNYGRGGIARLSPQFLRSTLEPGLLPVPEALFGVPDIGVIEHLILYSP